MSVVAPDLRNIIDFIEHQYLLTGEIPSAKGISTACFISEEEAVEWLADNVLQEMLKRRGITGDPNGLTPEMLACANVMLDFSDKRSKKDKLASLGLTTQQYNGFVKNKAFNAYVTTRAEQLLPDSMHEAHTALLRNVERGDHQSLKLYYEMTGRHNPAAQAQFNAEVMLTRIFEIITTRVKDPAILEAIAQDIGELAIAAKPQPTVQGEILTSL